MQSKILFLNSIIGALGVITCIQAVPIEVIYSGDACNCPKKLHYELNMPTPPSPIQNVPKEHGYQVEYPKKTNAKVIYSFDFDVEEPVTKLPLPESKLNIFAKIDRMTAHKKDCCVSEESPRKTCGCSQYNLGSRYVFPESSAARIRRNSRHPNSIDKETELRMEPATHIMAIFFKPLKQPIWTIKKTRNKRDISRIFTKPRKTEKRSNRIVKQYNKCLKDITANERRFFEETEKPIRTRAITSSASSKSLRPLQKLSNFIADLPNLRHKRDIKGEYDLIEKDREEMDLTLPEIIQYMPETLDPNFIRNQCNFGQNCHHSQLTDTTTPYSTTAASTTTSTTNPTRVTESVTEISNVIENNYLKNESKDQKEGDNDINSMHKKRNAFGSTQCGGCRSVIDPRDSPTPSPIFTYEPLAVPVHQPIPQIGSGASFNDFVSSISNEPILGATNTKLTIPTTSNAQLDQIISAIIHKHADFLESNVQANNDLFEPLGDQESAGAWQLV